MKPTTAWAIFDPLFPEMTVETVRKTKTKAWDAKHGLHQYLCQCAVEDEIQCRNESVDSLRRKGCKAIKVSITPLS